MYVLVEKGGSRSVMLAAVRSRCLLAKTFMVSYAASSFVIRRTAVYVVGSLLTTSREWWVGKEVVAESPGLGSCMRFWVARERLIQSDHKQCPG